VDTPKRLSQSRSQRIVWLLEELGVPYEVEIFHRNKETFLAPPELQKIHPLGKSPILTITPPRGETLTFAESGWMTQYLCEHFPEGRDRLTPKRWRDGMEGKIGGETEEWLRWQYFLHYNEGSLMPLLVTTLIIGRKYFSMSERICTM
jgi:glutathione S-transferase